jgi:CheY-like chemotaxis protein
MMTFDDTADVLARLDRLRHLIDALAQAGLVERQRLRDRLQQELEATKIAVRLSGHGAAGQPASLGGQSTDVGVTAESSRPPAPVVRPPRVLLVDDEASIRAFGERVLREAGYEVVVAWDGPGALQLLEYQPPFDLFVIDLIMPQMHGDVLAREIRRADPDAKVLYFTGHTDQLFSERMTLWAQEAFLEKPVGVQGLLEAVSLLLFGHTRGPRAPAS